MHALIIEDSYLLAMTVEDALSPIGYSSFDFAASVADAIAAAERRCPDLIVADQRLDNGTGTEAVRRICSGRTIPVVFVTGSASEVRAELAEAIIVDKPFAEARLHAAVREALGRPYCGAATEPGSRAY
jgi:DNA-binding response OmpR family regulator